MTFDISRLDTRTASEAGVPMPIRHPRTGQPILDAENKPVTITLGGPNSARYKELRRTSQLRRADMSSRGVALTDDDLKQERFDYVVALTKGWSFDTMDGKPFPFSEENARKLYADERWEWVTQAAWAHVNDDGAFLPS